MTEDFIIIDIKQLDEITMQATIVKLDGSKVLTTFPKYPIVDYKKENDVSKTS